MRGLDPSCEKQQTKNNARPIHRPTRSTHMHRLPHESSSGFSRFLSKPLVGGIDRASEHAQISQPCDIVFQN